MEVLLSDVEKVTVKLHTSFPFENTSCKHVRSQKNFTSVEPNKDESSLATSKSCK